MPFKIDDKVYVNSAYHNLVNAKATIMDDTSDLPKGHGDWLIELDENATGWLAVDKFDLSKKPVTEPFNSRLVHLNKDVWATTKQLDGKTVFFVEDADNGIALTANMVEKLADFVRTVS